jgi:hypothetical protein
LGAGCRRFKSYYPDINIKQNHKNDTQINFFKFVLLKCLK